MTNDNESTEDKAIIKQVYQNKSNKQLLICLPRNGNFQAGDYVSIKKLIISEESLNTS